MHPACPNKKQNHLQNCLLRRTQFWVRKTFSKPASLKRASLVHLSNCWSIYRMFYTQVQLANIQPDDKPCAQTRRILLEMCGKKKTTTTMSDWCNWYILGRPIFARLIFLTFWGPKTGPFFVILFAPISIALRLRGLPWGRPFAPAAA